VPGKRELPTNCYRVDPSGRIDLVVSEDQCRSQRIAFSPDYKKLYVISTGKGPGDTGPGGKGDMFVFDVGADNKLSNQKRFSDFMIDGINCGRNGVRCDVNGNVWASSNAGRHVAITASRCGRRPASCLGRIRLPEVCGNICLRRAQAQPLVHGREPVALRGISRHARGRHRLSYPAAIAEASDVTPGRLSN